ncbi:hypothetical protein T265_12851, partial [Opisthorchis viverrini]
VARVSFLVVGLFAVLGSWIVNISSPIVNAGFSDPLNPALMMSPRLVMKRLQSKCRAQRADQQSKIVERFQQVPDRKRIESRKNSQKQTIPQRRIATDEIPTPCVARVSFLVVGLFAVLGSWIVNISSPIVNAGFSDPLNPALMMSPRLVMKRLQSKCRAQRADQQSKIVERFQQVPDRKRIESRKNSQKQTIPQRRIATDEIPTPCRFTVNCKEKNESGQRSGLVLTHHNPSKMRTRSDHLDIE